MVLNWLGADSVTGTFVVVVPEVSALTEAGAMLNEGIGFGLVMLPVDAAVAMVACDGADRVTVKVLVGP